MEQSVDGKKIAEVVLTGLVEKKRAARLAIVIVGENPASLSYIKMKQKYGERAGVQVIVNKYPSDIEENELREKIREIGLDSSVDGIIIQLPLPDYMDRQAVLDEVSPDLDVDCLTSVYKAKLALGGETLFVPPAAAAVLKILEYYHIDLSGKKTVIIGSGDLIGRPLAGLLKNQGANFIMIDRQTTDLANLTKAADVIVSGTGQAGLLTGDMIRQGAVVIDAGTTGAENGTLVGDAEIQSVAAKASLFAAVPGGLGPVTVAMLFQNVVRSAIQRAGI